MKIVLQGFIYITGRKRIVAFSRVYRKEWIFKETLLTQSYSIHKIRNLNKGKLNLNKREYFYL